MPTEIIIHRPRSAHPAVMVNGAGAAAYPGQQLVPQGAGMQYPVAATPMMPATPLAPMAVVPTVQTMTPAPVVANLPRPLSAPPMALSADVYPGGVQAPVMNGVGYGAGYAPAYSGGLAAGYPDGGYGMGYGASGMGYNTGYGAGMGMGAAYGGGYYGGAGYHHRHHHLGRYGAGYGAGYPPAYYQGLGAAYPERPPFSQRVAGELEKLGGKLVDSERMVARGEARRAGLPVVPSTAQAHHVARRRAGYGYGGGRYVPGVGPTYY
ncbi:hypothetical protein BDW22DRAFT_1354835 [Trametopsis cervina]|nr:hypothetical protein BDW22DRAFT_1354835 [Trametopsis cervina]